MTGGDNVVSHVLSVTGDAAVAREGESVVVLVDHGQTWGPLEVLCSQTVLKHQLRCEKTYKIVVSEYLPCSRNINAINKETG